MRLRHALSRFAPLLLAALLVRALLPLGWMPVAQEGSLRWQLCPSLVAVPPPVGDAMHAMAGHEQRDPHAGHEGKVGKDACPFGALSALGGDVPQPSPLADRLPYTEPAPVAFDALALAQLRWLGHAYARGPPSIA